MHAAPKNFMDLMWWTLIFWNYLFFRYACFCFMCNHKMTNTGLTKSRKILNDFDSSCAMQRICPRLTASLVST